MMFMTSLLPNKYVLSLFSRLKSMLTGKNQEVHELIF